MPKKPKKNKCDDIVSAIDRALNEPWPESKSIGGSMCWRCSIRPSYPKPGLMCKRCRDWMMGETDIDPRKPLDRPRGL